MKDYSNIVISIFDKAGNFYEVESSAYDVKHLSAYKRLIEKMGNDSFGIAEYISRSSNKASITGFEIAKFVAASGNVVLFHTDVHNAFFNKKEASVMYPKEMSDIQKDIFLDLLTDLSMSEFNLYIGYAYFSKKKKVCYQRIPYNITYLSNEKKESEIIGRRR